VNQTGAIDVHNHVVPDRFPAYAGSGRDVPWPSMAPGSQPCYCNVMIQGKNYRTVHQSCWVGEDRIREMDARSIGTQCLSPMPELLSYWLPAADAQVLIRFLNDYIAEMVARNPGRFRGLGAVPLQDVDLAVRELEYVTGTLRFPGIEIASHVNGVSIGDARFEPFFAAAVRLNAAIFVHALRPAGQDRIVGPLSEQAVCFPGDIGLAAASLITGGMAERHAALRIAFSHGGGALPVMIPRLTHAWKMQKKMHEQVPREPGFYAKRFYYDSIVFDPGMLKQLVSAFGETQVVVGSDYPFAMGDLDPVNTVSRAGLPAAQSRAILRDNAERFLGITKSGN
jgi:aminocarboxymuconate-semialdehyde decarboxylase